MPTSPTRRQQPVTAPTVLAFDCSGAACSVAVATRSDVDELIVLAHREQVMQRGHAAALAPMIATTLTAADVRAADLDLIAVTIGPGSFTGVRIGLATARGLALALDVPVAGLTTIDALLAGATAMSQEQSQPRRRRVLAAIDTHRGDYYVGFDGASELLVADVTLIAIRAATESVLVVGDGATSLCPALMQRGVDALPVPGPTAPDARVLARLALRHDVEHWRVANRRDGMPRPLYLRPADVTLPKAAG